MVNVGCGPAEERWLLLSVSIGNGEGEGEQRELERESENVVLQKRGGFFPHSRGINWGWGEGEEGGKKERERVREKCGPAEER